MAFDPDAFLSTRSVSPGTQTTRTGFDPDAFLSSGNLGGFSSAPSAPQPAKIGGPLGQAISTQFQEPSPARMLEEQVAGAMQPQAEEDTPQQRRDKIGKLRAKYVDYNELYDFLDQLEADDTLDYTSLEKEFLYAIGERKKEREQEKMGIKMAQQAAKDEERRYEKFRREQLAIEEKAAKEQQRLAELEDKKALDLAKTETKSQTDLQKETIKAGAVQTGLTENRKKIIDDIAKKDPFLAQLYTARYEAEDAGDTKKVESLDGAISRQRERQLAIAATKDENEVEKIRQQGLADIISVLRGTAAGLTLGASNLAFGAALGEEGTKAVAEERSRLGAAGEVATSVVTGLGAAGKAITTAAKVLPAAKTVGGAIAQRAGVQAGIGAVQGVNNAVAGLMTGQISKGDAAANITSSILSSAIAAPIAANVPGKLANAFSQVAGDLIVDLASDAAFTNYLKDEGFVKWFLERELPNLVVSAAGAGLDLKGAYQQKKAIKDIVREGLTRTINLDKGGGIPRETAETTPARQTEAIPPAGEPARALEPTLELAPERKTVEIDGAKYNFKNGDWFRDGSFIPVRSTQLLTKIEQEASRAIPIRKTKAIPLGEGAGSRPPVDEQVRVETPAVKAEDQVKAETEIVAPKTVYHGTSGPIEGEGFQAKKAGTKNAARSGYGISFTENKAGAEKYGPDVVETKIPNSANIVDIKDKNVLSAKGIKESLSELAQRNDWIGDSAKKVLSGDPKSGAILESIFFDGHKTTADIFNKNGVDGITYIGRDGRNTTIWNQKVLDEMSISPPTKPTPELPPAVEGARPAEAPAPMDIRAEAARKAKEGAVDVSGFAKLKQGFSRTWENLKAQNAADRDLLSARQGEAAADRLARETEANLNATRAVLRQRGQDDAQVARDMNLAIRAEGSLTVGDKTYSKENISDLGYMEARKLAKAAGITIPEDATKSQVIKLLMERTTPDMTPEQFASKYGLEGADKERWLQNFKDAEDLASRLGVRLDEAGLSGLGQYVSENVGYATRRYLRNIKEGFEPTPEARAKAEDIVAESVAKRVQNLGARASTLGEVDLNRYLNAPNDAEASTFIRNLTPAQREEANDIRKSYQGLRSAVTVITKDVESGATKIGVDPQQVRNIASSIVDDMLQPPRNLADSANAGAGNAINSLLRRDLKPVFRELFGEINDPAIIAGASRENQARNVARLAALSDMAKKSGFIETDAIKAKEKGWVRLASDQKVGGSVSDYDRRRFGVLAGSYVPPSVRAMLTNQDYHAIKLPEVVRSVEGAVNKIAGIQRGSTVNLRPKSWIRDVITNITTFAGGSGDLADPVTFGKHYKDAMKVIGKHAKAKASGDNKARGETERFFRMLAEKGIFRAQSSSYWDDVSDAITGSGKLATAWKTIGEGKSMFADMPVKYAAYMTRMEKAKSWGWSDAKAREWAMDGLTRHYDNRDAVPKSFRDVARKGLVPDYLTFKYSSIRARALQTKDIFKDLQRSDIPIQYRGRMLTSYLASLAAQPIIAGTRVGGKVAKYGAVLGTIYKGSEALSTDSEQVDDKELDDANRYFSPRYAQQDGKVYFTDTKNGKKRLTTFSLTGAVTASPFEDAIVGSLQAGVNPDLDNDLASKLFEATIGSDVPMLWNAFSEFVAGEPLLANYDNPGFFRAIADRRDAMRKATLLRKRGQEEAAIEQEKIGKEYGMEALMRIAGTADIVLGPLVGAVERGRTLESEQIRRERRMTETTEAGPRKPKGYGPEIGRPTEEYRPTLDTMDIASGQVFPFNVRIENIEDARSRVYSRAANLRAGMRDTSKETEEVQFEASTEAKREARKVILDAYMEPWVRNARKYLEWYGEPDVESRLKDALAKSNFSDWEIEYILQFAPPPPKKETGLGGKSLGNTLGPNPFGGGSL